MSHIPFLCKLLSPLSKKSIFAILVGCLSIPVISSYCKCLFLTSKLKIWVYRTFLVQVVHHQIRNKTSRGRRFGQNCNNFRLDYPIWKSEVCMDSGWKLLSALRCPNKTTYLHFGDFFYSLNWKFGPPFITPVNIPGLGPLESILKSWIKKKQLKSIKVIILFLSSWKLGILEISVFVWTATICGECMDPLWKTTQCCGERCLTTIVTIPTRFSARS